MRGTVSTRGSIAVPVEIRRALGLRSGTRVEFELRPDGALLRKRVRPAGPPDRIYGILKNQSPVDELMRRLRGPGLQLTPRRHRQRR
jgi:AbrB family looped-hinge helix DNA binding protein